MREIIEKLLRRLGYVKLSEQTVHTIHQTNIKHNILKIGAYTHIPTEISDYEEYVDLERMAKLDLVNKISEKLVDIINVEEIEDNDYGYTQYRTEIKIVNEQREVKPNDFKDENNQHQFEDDYFSMNNQ